MAKTTTEGDRLKRTSNDFVRAYGKVEELDSYRIKWLARIVYSQGFELVIAFVILVNALALATLTMPELSADTKSILMQVDEVALAIFVVELSLRILSYGRKPWKFFRQGWNIFDFVVVALTPIFQGQTTVVRLVRLFRLVRIFRFLPEVKILTASIVRSIPPLLSMGVLTTLLLFLYGMAGTYLFGPALPQAWGDITKSMMTLFVMLTLENFPGEFADALSVSGIAFPFFLSYMFVIVFTVLNILIGVVLNSMDQARSEDAKLKSELKDLNSLSAMLAGFLSDGKLSEGEIAELNAKIKNIRSGE